MAVTATLVRVTPNKITYLVNNAAVLGTTITFAFAGGATSTTAPDVVSDVAAAAGSFGSNIASRLRQVIRAGLDGLGAQAAGGWNQAEARDLLLSNSATQAGSALMPRATVQMRPVSGAAGGALVEVDANVDGSNRPTLVATLAAVAGDCLVDITLNASPTS